MTATPITAILGKALDGLTMRYEAIAQNVANVSTDRYRPMRVDFEVELRNAVKSGPAALGALNFSFRREPAQPEGSDNRLDLELAAAAQTSMRYAALVDLLGRRMAINRAAMGAGQ